MPYASLKDLPDAVKKLPAGAKRIWMAAFNAAFKQYDDEEKAFAVSWAAVKKKYVKRGDKWVAKQSETDMGFLQSLYQRAYEEFVRPCAALNVTAAAACEQVLSEDGADPAEMAQALEQAMGATYGHWALSSDAHFKGSLEHRICLVAEAAHAQGITGEYGFTVAVYPDYAIVCHIEEGMDGEYSYHESKHYFRVEYTLEEETGAVTFATPQVVELETIARPVAGDGTMVTQAVMKTENGEKFGKNAYLIIENPDEPSTWKVRIEETPGKTTVAQLGRAYAALTKGFRGNKVEAASGEIQAALKKLRGLYKKMGAEFPGDKQQSEETPEWVRQGLDPPGGERELIQSLSVLFQAESYDEVTGILKVRGIATVANVLNAMRQVYPTEVWEDNMPRLQRMSDQGRLVGEMEHPEDNVPRLDRTCVKWTRIWMDGNDVKFEADILPTDPHGKNLQTLIKGGVAVDVSSRGMGTTTLQDWNGLKNIEVVQRGFRCDAFDPVIRGASPGAGVQEIVQSSAAAEEDEMSEKLAQQVEQMAARQEKLEQVLSRIADRLEPKQEEKPAGNQEQESSETEKRAAATLQQMEKAAAVQEKMAVRSLLQQQIEELGKQYKPQFVNVYRNQMESAAPETIADFERVSAEKVALVEEVFKQAPVFPGNGFTVQKDVGARGPQTGDEVIEALVDGLPDNAPYWATEKLMEEMGGDIEKYRVAFSTPKRQCRQWLRTIAMSQSEGWNGPAAMHGYKMFLQGYSTEIIAEQVMKQACSECTTSLAGAGAPVSAIFVFPLIRRVFPQLIINEIAAIQPMDRPNGKIFYLDALKIATGFGFVDEGGVTVNDLMPIHRTDSLSDSYANDPGECEVAHCIKLRLASKSVDATTKKLYASLGIEVMQDLRAYHGLDGSLELMAALAREVALEHNLTALNEMLAGATAGNRTYGTVAPAGFTIPEWERYISRYVDLVSNDIFKQRSGDATHVIAGPEAALRLGAPFIASVAPRDGAETELFPGLQLAPFMAGIGQNMKVFKTNFWSGQNANKILIIRRGQEWSDTAYVWAPYLDYISPEWVNPKTFVKEQGLMSRVAHDVVNGGAMGTITVAVGSTGAQI